MGAMSLPRTTANSLGTLKFSTDRSTVCSSFHYSAHKETTRQVESRIIQILILIEGLINTMPYNREQVYAVSHRIGWPTCLCLEQAISTFSFNVMVVRQPPKGCRPNRVFRVQGVSSSIGHYVAQLNSIFRFLGDLAMLSANFLIKLTPKEASPR
jgi:hypothetical protein